MSKLVIICIAALGLTQLQAGPTPVDEPEPSIAVPIIIRGPHGLPVSVPFPPHTPWSNILSLPGPYGPTKLERKPLPVL